MRSALPTFLLLLGSCSNAGSREPPAPAVAGPCNQRSFEGSRFTVCDPKGGQLKLFAAGKAGKPLRSFAEVARTLNPNTVAFAMNAGMFDDAGRPIGLAIADRFLVHDINLKKGGGNFHLKPNGVFEVRMNGRAAIFVAAAPMPLERLPIRWLATQSGPMLVIDGKLHPQFEPDGTSRYIRNGVGVTRDSNALFVISEGPVSLGKFARFFRDALKTPNALYLDGSVSSLWDPANGRMDSFAPLGPIVVALKPAASAPDRASRAKS